MLLKCCTEYFSKFGKLSSGHRTGKGQFSFQTQKGAMPKNVLTTVNCVHFTCQQDYAQNLSSQASLVHEPRNSRCLSWVQKRRKCQRSNFQHLLDHRKSKFQKKSTSALLSTLKPLNVWITTNCGKFLKRWKYQTTFPVS